MISSPGPLVLWQYTTKPQADSIPWRMAENWIFLDVVATPLTYVCHPLPVASGVVAKRPTMFRRPDGKVPFKMECTITATIRHRDDGAS